MKQISALVSVLLFGMISAGRAATIPDLSFTDDSGKSYSLYSLLDQGKTFVIQHIDGY